MQNTMVEFEDGKVAPSTRDWVNKRIVQPLYSDAEPFLYFLDKYTTILAGGAKGVAKWCKNNQGKTLLDRLTVSDIAFSMLMYENDAYDVWTEEVIKATTCATEAEQEAFTTVACNKYHVQRGAGLALYQDGWTSDGREYFRNICQEIEDMKNTSELWSALKLHWAVYVKKYHKYSYVCKNVSADNVDGEESLNDENEEDDDDDCIVSLPGEVSYDDDDDLFSNDNTADNQSDANKRQRTGRWEPV